MVKPDFKALESGDDGLDESLGLYDSDGGGSKKRRMKKSGGGGGSGGGSGSRHKTKKPALLEDLEVNAKRLEDDIAALENEDAVLERRYEALKNETRELHATAAAAGGGGGNEVVDARAVNGEQE